MRLLLILTLLFLSGCAGNMRTVDIGLVENDMSSRVGVAMSYTGEDSIAIHIGNPNLIPIDCWMVTAVSSEGEEVVRRSRFYKGSEGSKFFSFKVSKPGKGVQEAREVEVHTGGFLLYKTQSLIREGV